MVIRAATVEDVEGVLPMVTKICALHEGWDPAKYGFLPEPAEMYRGWLGRMSVEPRAVFLIAEREGSGDEQAAPAGFLVATVEREIPVYRLKEYGFIHDVWVEEAYRNEGLARQMVMLAVERFAGMGVKQVRCDTARANETARKLFEGCGFRVSTVEMLIEL